MAKSLKQIRQELAKLEEETTQLSAQLKDLYRQYLEALSQSINQQLILAVYQICTQIYPEEFLKLSYNQREELQTKIRQLGQEINTKLLAYLELPQPSPQATITEQILMQLSLSQDPAFELPELEQENTLSAIKTPEDLVTWCKQLEQGIRITLDNLSQGVNHTLQQAQVIPNQLPPKLLEMALQAEEGGISAGNSPNILNLLVETSHKKDDEDKADQAENEEEETDAKITKMSAIHLRLSEIEFADPQLSIQRKGIRQELEKLKKMRKTYHVTQRELAKAEAEAAWRSSWHD